MAVDADNQPALTEAPVGRLLFDLLEEKEGQSFSERERERITALIDNVCLLIEKWRGDHKLSKIINARNLVDGLYPSFEKLDERKKSQLMTQCMLECLRWCNDVIRQHGVVPKLMLRNFVLDVACLKFLGAEFGMVGAGRSLEWIPEDSFGDAQRWYCFSVAPGRLTGEFMSIFELRQAMETRFRKLLGIKNITDGVKIKHDLIPAIVEKSITEENFCPQSGMTLTQIRHVYDWTDISIHLMRTDYVWLVWKAFQVCEGMFSGVPRKNGMMSIHDSFEFSEPLLEEMRRNFVAAVKASNPKVKSFVISWGKPEAAIVDDQGCWIEIAPREDVVTSASV